MEKEATTSHYMRHWNLYIMNELKEESLLKNCLVDVIYPRPHPRARQDGVGSYDTFVFAFKFKDLHSFPATIQVRSMSFWEPRANDERELSRLYLVLRSLWSLEMYKVFYKFLRTFLPITRNQITTIVPADPTFNEEHLYVMGPLCVDTVAALCNTISNRQWEMRVCLRLKLPMNATWFLHPLILRFNTRLRSSTSSPSTNLQLTIQLTL